MKCDWSEHHCQAGEAIPPDALEAWGLPVSMTCFIDADYAGCHVTRHSQSGIIIFVNWAPILWFSKQQNTIESSTFGSEFIAMKQVVDLSEGLCYKLRMMGITLMGPMSTFCDNESVVRNTTRPELTLKKKHNAITYHRVHEAQATGIMEITKIDGKSNLADILTKCLPGPCLHELISHILW